MNWLFYLLEANAYVIVFFAFYKILLHKETFYSLNRYFLILSTALSFLLPLVKLSSLNPVQNAQMNVYYAGAAAEEKIFTPEAGIAIFYVLIILVGLARLLLKLAQIYRMINSGTVEKIEKIYIVPSYQSLPFSFFNYLFISPDFEKQDTILRHEKVHIRQWHSADILYFELLAIINWFNPFVYLMQREIKAIHEFLADEQASREEAGLDEYALFLIRNSCATDQKYPTNQMFNQSLLRKRIIMLSKKKSPPSSRLKYGLLIMIIPVMVCVSSMAFTKSYGIDLARASAALQDTSKIGNEKEVPPTPSPDESKKVFPEPKVEQVKFPAPKKVASGAKVPGKNKQPAKVTSKKVFPEPKVEQVRFPAPKKVASGAKVPGKNSQAQKSASKKVFPEPKVEQVKFPAPKKVASGSNVQGKNKQAQKSISKKDIPEPKVEQVKFPAPPKEAPKPGSPPVVSPEDKQIPPPPPPVEPEG